MLDMESGISPSDNLDLTESVKEHAASWDQQDMVCSAFTVAELGELLPKHTFDYKDSVCFISFINYEKLSALIIGTVKSGTMLLCIEGSTEVEARAAMLIHILTNNLTAQP